MASLSNLQEPFTGSATPTGWTETDITATSFTYDSTGVTINLPASTTSSTDGDLNYTATNDLTGGFARIAVLGVSGAGATHTDNVLRIRQNSTNYVTIFYEAGSIFFSKVVASSQTNIASATYSATTHAWWQIRERNGITYWETSVDGQTWTTRAVQANPITLTDVDVLIGAICFGIDVSPSPFKFRGFNYPQAGTTTSVSSTSISSTSSSTSSTSTSISSTSSSTSSTSTSISTSSTSTSVSSTSSSISSTSSSTSSTSTSSTSSSTSVSSTSSSISSTSTSSTSTSSTSSSTSVSSTSSSFSSTSSSISSTSASTSSTSVSTSSTSSSTSTTTLPPPYFNYTYQDIAFYKNVLVQQVVPTVVTTGSTFTITPATTIQGNMILLGIFTASTTNVVTGITDSGNNVYTKIFSNTANTAQDLEMWVAINTQPTNSIIITFAGASSAKVAIMNEYSGVDSSSFVFDRQANKIGSSASLSSGSTPITRIANELVVCIGADGGSGAISVGAGFGNFAFSNWSASRALAIEDSLATSISSLTGTMTGPSSTWVCGIATFPLLPIVPTTNTDLSNKFTAVTYGNVSGDDGDYFIARGSKFLIQEYKDQHQNNSDSITFTWKGRSTLSTLISPILMQIYNNNSSAWETVMVHNTVPADTDFVCSYTQTANLSNYYDSTNTVTFRSYQLVV